jgi:Peptidase family M28/PDZ domain/PA domain
MLTKFRIALLVLTLGLAGLVGRAALAQEKDAITERMKKDITFLASDECEGRGVGTLGLDLAAQYIAVQFKMAGLKPGGVNGTYFQPFPFCTGSQLDGESSVTTNMPKGKKRTLKQGEDFQVLGSSASAKLTAPVVFVGYGVTGRGIAYDDYAGLDVKGKIVVALRRLPRWTDNEKPFDPANKDELSALEYKQIRGYAAKAAAVILVNDASDDENDALIPFTQMSRSITTVSMPYVQMKREVLDEMLKAGTGKGLADIEKSIDADLKPQSGNLNKTTMTMNIKVKRKEDMVKNVIGYLEGSGPLADETIVVGAHYDHLGYGGFGSAAGKTATGKIHHGADDNGSGSTSVIELARRFGAMKGREGRRIVFMTFTAEERGLIGSRHYCRVEPLFALKDTAAMLNLDMVGRMKEPKDADSKPKLLALGISTGKGFDNLVKKHNADFDLVNDTGGPFGASDHYSFYQQKIPVLFFWTGFHPDYHRPTDTSDKINVSGMKKVADFSEKLIAELSTDPKRYEYVPIKSNFNPGGPRGPRMGFTPDYEFGGKGARIEAVSDGGPAALAGLKKGDVIIEVAGKAVANVEGYMSAMRTQKIGAEIEIKILRDNKEMQLKVTPK